MRAVLLVVGLSLAVGCAKKEEGGGESGDKGNRETEDPPIAYSGEYDGENPIAADAKYKGKRVIFKQVEIVHISQTKDGRAYIAPLSVLLVAPSAPAGTGGMGGHTPQRVPEPSHFFFLRDASDAKKVKTGSRYEVAGVCRGFTKDNLWRGGIAWLNWHVDYDDCTVTAKLTK